MHQVETMIETGKAPYPVERTLLISGILESCLDSAPGPPPPRYSSPLGPLPAAPGIDLLSELSG